ncbi:hypothetical protein SAMN02745866_02507 [Alteromonadaceae bacterium Bs31]|nr:hypothetical protein SAMN02745866_02507 [Alteromonadaceae bacterium Bs31]
MTHCLFALNIEAVTAELKIRFFHPVPCFVEVLLQARLIKSKAPLYIAQADLSIDGIPFACAEAKFMCQGKAQ